MLLLNAYILMSLVALTWIACDSGMIAIFELFQRDQHVVARDMGMYWSWALRHTWRCVVLLLLVASNATLASLLLAQNPFQLDAVGRTAVFGAMLIGSLVMIPWIFVADSLRRQRQFRSKATQLTRLVALVGAEPDLAQHLEPAGYDSDDSWTAWHPRLHNWHEDYWTGIVPVLYVRQREYPTIVVPLDWRVFLAWNLPAGIALPGRDLPFHGPGGSSFRVRSAYGLKYRPGWTVINADLYDEALEEAESRG